jgi:hypothetical protein
MHGHADQTLQRLGIVAQFMGRCGMHHRAAFQHQRAARVAERFLHLLFDDHDCGLRCKAWPQRQAKR